MDDRALWTAKLSNYPKWKLIELDNFSLDERGYGRTLSHVCKYLDALRPRPELNAVREDLGYRQIEHKPRKEIAHRTIDHCKSMMDKNKTPKELDLMEREFVSLMKKDFPNINWTHGRKNNQTL